MYTVNQIASITGGRLIKKTHTSQISQLIIDSRKISFPTQAIFFALKSERNNGHLFINKCYDKGVRNFIISESIDLSHLKDCNIIQVNNTLKALQNLVTEHRKQFAIPVIGITGSNGKTIVKEWIYQLLASDFNIARSPKSYNSQIGVPLSVWQLHKEHNLACFEAGISKPDEMKFLQPIINPTIGIFTTIGTAHAENFTDEEQKIKEKLILFKHAKTIIYNNDYSSLHKQIQVLAKNKHIQLFSWSKTSSADLRITKIIKNSTLSTHISASYKNKPLDILIPFTDDASIENAIHCWALLLLLNYSNDIIKARMLTLLPLAMRLELKEGINNCSLINDSYSADLSSLTIALDFLKQQNQHTKTSVILSDFLQSGLVDSILYKHIANILKQHAITQLIGIGENISKYKKLFPKTSYFYKTTDEFLSTHSLALFSDESILLKGARGFTFERINHVLQQRTHESVLEINLDALIYNLNYYRSLIPTTTKLMTMVKAFSYGSGSFEIANQLQFHHTDYLAVAYADEGIELRKAGIHLPILVMNPEENTFDNILEYNLEPEIYSLYILKLLDKSIAQKLKKLKKTLLIHIKIDTGMHRLGFDETEIPELISFLKNRPYLKIQSVFSHLAASDDNQHDAFTHQQIRILKRISQKIKTQFKYPFLTHIENSAGITRFKEGHMDMVRLGIGLYGISNLKEEQKNLHNVSTFKTCISQIKYIDKSDTIGYNRKGTLTKDTTIAIIPVGYADGIHRNLGNSRGKFYFKGHRVPIIGNVCMDMCMIDITNIKASEGDEVIIFGSDYPITELAKQANTIPYEILTGISRRVKRVYFQE